MPHYVQVGIDLVVQTGHDHGAVGHHRHANSRGPEQVRSEDDGVKAVLLPQESFEQPGRAEQGIEPGDLVVEGRHLAGIYPAMDGMLLAGRRGQHVFEPPDQDALLHLARLGQLVGPRVGIDGTGGQHFDRPVPLHQAQGDVPHHGLGTPDDLRTEARAHEGHPSL